MMIYTLYTCTCTADFIPLLNWLIPNYSVSSQELVLGKDYILITYDDLYTVYMYMYCRFYSTFKLANTKLQCIKLRVGTW